MITASIATNGGAMLGLTCADRIALTSIKALVDELTLGGVIVVGILCNRVSVATGKRDADVEWGWMMASRDLVGMVLR